jgi:hypothetical protein
VLHLYIYIYSSVLGCLFSFGASIGLQS